MAYDIEEVRLDNLIVTSDLKIHDLGTIPS